MSTSDYILPALVIAGGFLLFSGSASAKGHKRPKLDPKPGPGGGGRVWRLPAIVPNLPTPAEFDYAGNGIHVDTQCEFVAEGDLFWPREGFGVEAAEASSVAATLSIPGNSIVGWLDYMIDTQGVTDPLLIAATFLEEVSPMCSSVDDSQWGDGLFAWYDDFVGRVTDYAEQGTIEFGGDE